MEMIKRLLIGCFAMLLLAFSAGAATLTVSKTADTNDGTCDADCSFREAIVAANTSAENDIIIFGALFASPQVITMTAETIITNSGTLSIFGPGANRLTISGNNSARILTNNTGSVTMIKGIRFTGGNGVSTVTTGRGGALYNNGGNLTIDSVIVTGNTAANGGGLNNAGTATLTIRNSIISNNTASGSGGGMQNFSGNTANIFDSTFTGNVCNSTSTGGGAIQANGTLTITNTTFSGNTASGGDGGALFYNGLGMNMTNTTIAGNTATGTGAGGFHKSTSTLNANIRNSVIGGNTGGASPDVVGAFNSMGNNLIQVIGSSTGWVASDLQNVNPQLSPLGFHGGFGMTHIPLSGSPAVDAGQNCVLDQTCSLSNPPIPVTADQRGVGRPVGASVDIGSVESSGNYSALLPSAGAGVAYNFTLVPANSGFNYALNSGSFGGISVNSTTSTTLAGTAAVPGIFNGLVQVTGPGQGSQNYRIYVLANPNFVTVSGRVLSETRSVPNKVYVVLTGYNGTTYYALVNPFGYYQFSNIPAGFNAVASVSSKTDSYISRQLLASDVVENFDLAPLPAAPAKLR